MSDGATYERVEQKVHEAEKKSTLKNLTLTKWQVSLSGPIEDAFKMIDRDMVDMRVMKGLCANGIPI